MLNHIPYSERTRKSSCYFYVYRKQKIIIYQSEFLKHLNANQIRASSSKERKYTWKYNSKWLSFISNKRNTVIN